MTAHTHTDTHTHTQTHTSTHTDSVTSIAINLYAIQTIIQIIQYIIIYCNNILCSCLLYRRTSRFDHIKLMVGYLYIDHIIV